MVSQGDLCLTVWESCSVNACTNEECKVESGVFWKDGEMVLHPAAGDSVYLLPSFFCHPSSPALIGDVEIWPASTCFPFLGGQGALSQHGFFGFIFSKCFLHGTLLRVPSWPPICTTQLGEVAKKSELLECSGPRNLTLRGSLVLARMSL